MGQYKIGEVEMKFAEIIWRLEPVPLVELAEAVRREFGWKKSETERMVSQLCGKGIFVMEKDLVKAKVSQSAFRQTNSEEEKSESSAGRAGKRKKSSGGFLHSFWAPIAFEEGDAVSRIKNIMKYRKTFVVLAVCAVLVCILGGALFLMKAGKKEFSFQNLKREDIQKVEFNTRDDFYYTFDEEETDVICRMLQKIVYADSGTEDVDPNGKEIRLTLMDGEEIDFSCSGHTIRVQDKSYYVEGDVLERIEYKCWNKWLELCSENERRDDFYDLYEATVRDVKIYEGISLCYTLNEEERKETLQALRNLGSFTNHYVSKVDETEEWFERMGKRFLVEKEDGVEVEFYVNPQRVCFNENMIAIPEEKGRVLKEKQDAWLQTLREETRQMPFSEISAEKIASVSVLSYIKGSNRELSAEEREELLALLRDIVIVGTGTKDYEGLVGGIPTEAFQIEDTEGNVITISANDDPFVVNGKGYCIENTDKAEKLEELYYLWGRWDMEEPVENQEIYEDEFRLTLRSEHPWYQRSRFTKNALFTLELEYIGEEEEIQIWHGDPLAMIDIETEDGRCLWGFVSYQVKKASVLKKGEPYRLEINGETLGKWLKWLEEEGGFSFSNGELSEGYAGAEDVLENGSLKPGDYHAVAYVEFSTDDNQETERDWNLKLSLDFGIR